MREGVVAVRPRARSASIQLDEKGLHALGFDERTFTLALRQQVQPTHNEGERALEILAAPVVDILVGEGRARAFADAERPQRLEAVLATGKQSVGFHALTGIGQGLGQIQIVERGVCGTVFGARTSDTLSRRGEILLGLEARDDLLVLAGGARAGRGKNADGENSGAVSHTWEHYTVSTGGKEAGGDACFGLIGPVSNKIKSPSESRRSKGGLRSSRPTDTGAPQGTGPIAGAAQDRASRCASTA